MLKMLALTSFLLWTSASEQGIGIVVTFELNSKSHGWDVCHFNQYNIHPGTSLNAFSVYFQVEGRTCELE